jgi:selenocysteine-specific elongation factor
VSTESARHLVVGTAGHIDHGKSALVAALTGTHPDRLDEERRRGITIDLGFADFEPRPGRVISFVDVPGHERFVRHMVAGAGGVDAVLLAVAADEGVMPQTREHLAICRHLGIRHGIVALTKADLVADELRQVVALEVEEFARGSFLEGAPLVSVSAKTGEGLDALRAALAALFDLVAARPVSGVPRLPVDRTFTMKGFGTVVTGTLVSGSLHEGEEVELLPGGRRARVRGLQVHRRKTVEASAGRRVAVNLQGVDVADVPRGTTLTSPSALTTTRRIRARVRLEPGMEERLGRGGLVRFHQGTFERSARLRLRGADPADGTQDAEILFREDTVLVPGDRFVLRRPAPVDTLGGGIVTDLRPLRSGEAGAADSAAALARRVAAAGTTGVRPSDAAAELGVRPEELEEIAAGLARAGRVVRAPGVILDAGVWKRVESAVIEAVEAFHRSQPLRRGASREELRSAVAPAMPPDSWRQLLEGLRGDAGLRLEGDRVASARHTVVLSGADGAIAAALEARLRDAGLDPPDTASLLAEHGGGRAMRLLEWLVSEGRLVRLKDGRLCHGEALDGLRAKLMERAKVSRKLDVASFKELAGVTRKNAIPLLEFLDAERSTRRVGNDREILI